MWAAIPEHVHDMLDRAGPNATSDQTLMPELSPVAVASYPLTHSLPPPPPPPSPSAAGLCSELAQEKTLEENCQRVPELLSV